MYLQEREVAMELPGESEREILSMSARRPALDADFRRWCSSFAGLHRPRPLLKPPDGVEAEVAAHVLDTPLPAPRPGRGAMRQWAAGEECVKVEEATSAA